MLPDPEDFTRELRALGLNQRSSVVIYDSMGMYSAPRAWWMLRVMGFTRTAMLDGGLMAWESEGYEVGRGADQGEIAAGDFTHIIAGSVEILGELLTRGAPVYAITNFSSDLGFPTNSQTTNGYRVECIPRKRSPRL